MIANSPGSTTNCLVDVPERQPIGRDRPSATVCVSPGCERDPLESLELLHGPRDGAHQVADVELHDFVAGALARVRHVDQHARRFVAADRRLAPAAAGRTGTSCSSGRSRTDTAATLRRTGSRGGPTGGSCRYAGRWPTERGIVIGSLPPGFTSPNSTSATARPVSWPRYQHSKIAAAFSARLRIDSGRPLNTNATIGLPVAAIASTSSSCWPTMSRRRAVAQVIAHPALRATSARCRRWRARPHRPARPLRPPRQSLRRSSSGSLGDHVRPAATSRRS